MRGLRIFGNATSARRSGLWVSGASYVAGEIVVNGGQPYTAVDNHVAGATFSGDSAHWNLILPGQIITQMPLSTAYVMTASFATIPGWQIVVPANSGAIELAIPELLLACSTGTNAVGTVFQVEVKVVDEAAATAGYALFKPTNSIATAQSLSASVSLYAFRPNNGSTKTYSVQARCSLVGTNSCTASLHASSSGFIDPVLLARRT